MFILPSSVKRQKRALLLPSYASGGFGHASRCLALADELSRQNWAAAMVLAGPHVSTVTDAGYRVFSPRLSVRYRRTRRDPVAYLCFHDGNLQAIRDGLTHPWKLRLAVAEVMRFIRRFRPDVLVGDISLLTWIAGSLAGLPVVQVLRSIMHPAAPRIIWWEEPPAGMISPDIRPVFNPVLERWGLDPIDQIEDLLRGDLFLVPSIPELEPLPATVTDTCYTGAILRRQADAQTPFSFPTNGPDWPLVYVTVGGGAGPVGSRRFFQTLSAAFDGVECTVLVSTGTKFAPADLPAAPSNIHFHQWVPGVPAIQRSNVVVFHGGYGTTMETVQLGVPSVVLPFHSEQESNGRRLQACGVSRVLSPTVARESMRLVRSQWRYGEFATWVQPVSPLTADVLREAVLSVLNDPGYRQRAAALRARAETYAGAAAAVEQINRLI